MERVKITGSEMVKPAVPPPNSGTIHLSIYDWVMRYALYQRRVLFYTAPMSSFQLVVSSLKNSLAKALVSFYPLAGRISVGHNGRGFVLDCSNLSVQFSEAVTDSTLKELQLHDFAPSEFCDQLCQVPAWPWSQEQPLLYVQVTKFSDDGLSIGITFSHHVADGVSAWHFIRSWSQVEKLGTMLNPPDVTYEFKPLELSDEETVSLAASIGFKAKDNRDAAANLVPAWKLSTKLFKLDRETISRMKALASSCFSSYEVICAYFWRQITLARSLPPHKEVKLFVLFNCRQRFGGLTKYYFGNAISMAVVSCTAAELISNSLGFSAGLIHSMVQSFDERRNQAHINFVDRIIDKGYLTEIDVDPAAFSLVVSSPRHPIYECDFGFGKPAGVTFGTNDLHEGKIYLFPSSTQGSVDVRVVLQPPQLEKVQLEV